LRSKMIGCFYILLLFNLTLLVLSKRTSINNQLLNLDITELAAQLEKETDLYQIEKILAKIEYARFQILLTRLKAQGYEIEGFYHTSKWQQHWQSVIFEQLALLDGKRKLPHKQKEGSSTIANLLKLTSPNHDPKHADYYLNQTLPYAAYDWDMTTSYTSLLNVTHNLHINIVGEKQEDYTTIKNFIQQLPLDSKDKIIYGYNQTIGRWAYNSFNDQKKKEYDAKTDLSTGEYSTITQLYQYCRKKHEKKEKAIVYYLHNKGTCCMKDTLKYDHSVPVANWREYMNTVNLEFPSICLRAILTKKYLACGAENQDGHYSGNYWWADCDHVAQLQPLRFKYDFGESEYFVLRGAEEFGTLRNFGFKCGYSIYNCGVNLYDNECPRWKYRNNVLLKSIPGKLLPNNVYKKDDWTGKCRELMRKDIKYWEMADEVRRVIQG